MTETTTEKFSWIKFFSGIGKWTNIAKLGIHGINLSLIGMIVFGGFSLWQLFKKPTPPPVQRQSSSVVFEKDSGVKEVNIVNSQQTADKKTVGIVAAVSSVDVSLGFKKYLNDNLSVEIGPRWKFQAADGDKDKIVPQVTIHYDF
jgi:hypothetical protein